MAFKCAHCGAAGKDVVGYCVETNKVMCRRCVGLLHYPGMKSADFTIEELDKQHPGVQWATTTMINVSVVFGMLAALWHSGIGDEYFKGQGTCPGLSVGRQMLARWDANIFYYYKSTLATSCDIEDSFWRLLMDGWVRGVVSGSDSLLLLFSTLPKALLFKQMASTFLRPVCAVVYAISGMALSVMLVRFEDAGMWLIERSPSGRQVTATSATGTQGKFAQLSTRVMKLPSKLKERMMTKNTALEKVRMVFIGVGLSTMLRLAVHAAGFHFVAALGNVDVNIWQLLFEPLCCFYVAHLCGWLQTKLSKTVWKKGAVSTATPLTLWRTKPNKDYMELFGYARGRFTRSYSYYRQQAQDILHILVDDIFNAVVALRLVSIIFSLAPFVRSVAMLVGLGPLIQRHSAWFYDATGFVENDAGAAYISDRLLGYGFHEIFVVSKMVGAAVEGEILEEVVHVTTIVHQLKQSVWRLFLPAVFLFFGNKWQNLMKQQQGEFKKSWKGTNWSDGAYAEMLEQHGSFFNQVENREDWVPPKTK